MRLRLVKEPFDNPDYTFELKQDGFRATAVPNAILDGEIIVLDNKGVSQSNAVYPKNLVTIDF